jgi:hypothetical protein
MHIGYAMILVYWVSCAYSGLNRDQRVAYLGSALGNKDNPRTHVHGVLLRGEYGVIRALIVEPL